MMNRYAEFSPLNFTSPLHLGAFLRVLKGSSSCPSDDLSLPEKKGGVTMETSVKQAVNMEATAKKADQKSDSTINRNINRNMIIDKVYRCGEWLERKAKQKKGISSVKIQAMRGAIHSYHVVLEALKDVELDKLNQDVEAIKKHLRLW